MIRDQLFYQTSKKNISKKKLTLQGFIRFIVGIISLWCLFFLSIDEVISWESDIYLYSALLTVHEYRLLTAGSCSHVCGFQIELQL